MPNPAPATKQSKKAQALRCLGLFAFQARVAACAHPVLKPRPDRTPFLASHGWFDLRASCPVGAAPDTWMIPSFSLSVAVGDRVTEAGALFASWEIGTDPVQISDVRAHTVQLDVISSLNRN